MVPRYVLSPSGVKQDREHGEYVHVSDFTAALNTAVAAIQALDDVEKGEIPATEARTRILVAAALWSHPVKVELAEKLQ